MIKRMVASALFAGFAAGLIAALLQLVFVQPVLLQAERYEAGELVHFAARAEGHDHAAPAAPAAAEQAHDHSAHEHGDGGLAAGIDWQRDGLSILFTVLVYTGYALLLVAAFALAEGRGTQITPRQGLIWGLAAFIIVQFAPAAGLPPELPGMAAADLGDRQVWWMATVIATAAGLWLIAFGKSWVYWIPAVALILAPHAIGAPHPAEFAGPTPPELAGLFAGRALAVGMAAFACLGLVSASLWQREAA